MATTQPGRYLPERIAESGEGLYQHVWLHHKICLQGVLQLPLRKNRANRVATQPIREVSP
jgi:hypothetical protein